MTRGPVKAFDLIAEDCALDSQYRREHNFKRIAFDPARDRVEQSECRFLIICPWRKDDGRSMAGLLATGPGDRARARRYGRDGRVIAVHEKFLVDLGHKEI